MEFAYTTQLVPLKLNNFLNFIKEQFRPKSKNNYINTKPISTYEAEFNSQTEILNLSSLLSISDLRGNIIYVNDKFCEVSQYTREELMDQPHSIVRHPDTPASVFKEMWQTIGKGETWQGEIKNKAKDGTHYWVYATISPVMGENGKPIKYISMRHDISKQKSLTEELTKAKNSGDIELHENVTYAKSVHNTFLTSTKTIKEIFPESLLIYKAQNIISGDFYMLQRKKDQVTIIMGDSTGHGVSASYMSIMILNILSRILKSSSICPGKTLVKLHQEILSATCSNKGNPIIESADMAICLIDQNKLVMEYALAKLRGIIIRNGEAIDLEREKCTIGEQSCEQIVIKRHFIDLRKGDVIYLYTDGIIDQYGGLKDKKFGSKQLLKFLKENSMFPMEQQKQNLNEILKEWQGANKQTDDMSLMGIRIQ